jgi:hypothetical protein
MDFSRLVTHLRIIGFTLVGLLGLTIVGIQAVKDYQYLTPVLWMAGVVISGLIVGPLVRRLFAFDVHVFNLKELEPIRQERAAIQKRIGQEQRADVLDTIQLSLNQLAEYYTISKGQARGSFLVSVVAMILGFVTLISGIWILFVPNVDPAGIRTISTVSTIGGVLTQFVGASYFYLYNKTIAQMNYFYERLVKLQDTMLSIRLCDGIEEKSLQYALREKLVLTILQGSYEEATGRGRPTKRQGRTARSSEGNTQQVQVSPKAGVPVKSTDVANFPQTSQATKRQGRTAKSSEGNTQQAQVSPGAHSSEIN